MAKQNNIHYQKNGKSRSGKNAIYYQGVRRKGKNLASFLNFLYLFCYIGFNVFIGIFLITFGIFFGIIKVVFTLIFNYRPDRHEKNNYK